MQIADPSESTGQIGQTFVDIRDFVASTKWDGIDRSGCYGGAVSWLTTYFEAPDSTYTRCVGRWWLIAAIARVMQPGCQADYALVFRGSPGSGKSSALRALFEPWFLENIGNLKTNRASGMVTDRWCVEIDLDGHPKNALLKMFISRRSDMYRPPYDRRPRSYPRQCVLACTTNKPFNNVMGNRRFWPVHCGSIHVKQLRDDRAQIWAQALALWQDGSPWWPAGGDDLIGCRKTDGPST